MVNHLRTLLLNLSGMQAADPTAPGEEFVPIEFSPRPLPGDVVSMRRMLFGTDPDRTYMNYRLRQYLTTLHGSGFDSHVRRLDPRITYWPPRDFPGRWQVYGTTTVTPDPGMSVVLNGPLPLLDVAGKCVAEWDLEIASGTAYAQAADGLAEAGPSDLDFSGGLSSPVRLPGSALTFTVREGTTGTYTIRAVARPVRDPGEILAAVETSIGGDVLASLFPRREPFTELAELWRVGEYFPVKFGALVVATAYRIAESRGEL